VATAVELVWLISHPNIIHGRSGGLDAARALPPCEANCAGVLIRLTHYRTSETVQAVVLVCYNSMMAVSTQRFPLRFGMRTLLAAVAVSALAVFGANWAVRNAEHQAAAAAYERVNCPSRFDPFTACVASEDLMKAAMRMPFSDGAVARREHLDRIVSIRQRDDSVPRPPGLMCGTGDPSSFIAMYYERAMRAAQ
jgi:hypothetical protein